MIENSIVDEIHRIREEILAEYGGDLHLLIADAPRLAEKASREGWKVLPPPQQQQIMPDEPDPSRQAHTAERPETRKVG